MFLFIKLLIDNLTENGKLSKQYLILNECFIKNIFTKKMYYFFKTQ